MYLLSESTYRVNICSFDIKPYYDKFSNLLNPLISVITFLQSNNDQTNNIKMVVKVRCRFGYVMQFFNCDKANHISFKLLQTEKNLFQIYQKTKIDQP